MLNKLKKTNYKYLAIAFAAFAIALIAVLLSKDDADFAKSYTLEKRSLSEVVEASGKVEAAQSVDLSFERSGTVAKVSYKPGDMVSSGAVLASLSLSDSQASIDEARASIAREEAVLADIQAGATAEEQASKEQAITNAKKDLENSYFQVSDSVRNTYSKFSDVLNFKLSSILIQQSTAYTLSFSSCDQGLQTSVENTRLTFDATLEKLEDYSDEIDSDNDGRKDDVLDDVYKNTIALNNFISNLNILLNQSCVAQNSNLNDKRIAVSESKTIVNSIFSDISARKSVIQSGKNAVSRAERDYDLAMASADVNKVNAQKAVIASARARLAQQLATQEKNILRAPFAGVVTAVNIEKGEIASTGKTSISMISSANFQIEIEVTENDISKVNTNDKVNITLDAFAKEKVFEGVVTRVDPAPTSNDSGSRYKTIISFKENYNDLKIGMTANAKIITDTRENVLVVPPEYLTAREGKYFVKVANGENVEEKEVAIGVRGDNGDVEIVSGVQAGEKVVVDKE